MKAINFVKKTVKPRLELLKGTRIISFLFIGTSILIAAGILWGASVYYNIDTGEVVMEEIQRVTGVLRATTGAIVGGTASQNPTAGYVFEVVGQTRLGTTTFATGTVELTGAEQVLRFSGGTSYYTGFRATTTMGTTTIYYLPPIYASTSDWVLTWQAGNQLQWKPATSTPGVGDITAVGDVASGAAFTADGTGSSLWFHQGSATGTLTVASLTANATYTLPNISGTNYLTLTANSALGTGGVLFSSSGLIATSSNLYWDDSSRYLRIGNSGTDGTLRIYSSNASGYYLGFGATSTMTTSTPYYWPTTYGTNNYVLTTDGTTGNLAWESVSGAGAVDTLGTPVAGQVSFFYDADTIMGDTGFTWASTTDALTIAGSIISPIYTSSATTTIQSGTNGILLDPTSGKIVIASGDWIETYQGYQIGKSGEQVLREMIPIFGFDLPAKTATSGTTTISRTIQTYPFSACATGTSRIHKLVIRYGSATTTSWQTATSGGALSTFTVPTTNSTTSGTAYTASVNIPTPTGSCTGWSQTTDTDDWWVRMSAKGYETMVYQIFLAAYDQIQ